MQNSNTEKGGVAKRALLALLSVVFAVVFASMAAFTAFGSEDSNSPKTAHALGDETLGISSPLLAVTPLFDYDDDTWADHIDVSWYVGHENDTVYHIATAEQLAGLASITSPDNDLATDAYVTAGETPSRAKDGDGNSILLDNFEGKTVYLEDDIDLKAYRWIPISETNRYGKGGQGSSGDESGTYKGVAWKGTFDGGGHVILDMNVDGRIENAVNYWGFQGLFSAIGWGGVIRNIGVQGEMYARVGGGIVACSEISDTEDTYVKNLMEWPRIENCWTYIVITGNGSGSRACGGIFGGEDKGGERDICNIINCYSMGTINNVQAAGISGVTNGIVSGCYSTATVTGNFVGGITSWLYMPVTSTETNKNIGMYLDNNMAYVNSCAYSYRYYDGTTGSEPISVTDMRYTYDEIQNGVGILGNAYVKEDSDTPYLFWEEGLSEIDLSGATMTLTDNVENPVEPFVTVTLNGTDLKEYATYFVTYENDGSGTATATAYGIGRYTGSVQKSYEVPVDPFAVEVAPGDYVYTTSAIEPDVTVTCGGVTLEVGVDYTLSFSDNTAAGTATVTATGIGSYAGQEATATFTIEPADIADCTIGSIEDQKSTGESIEPEPTISDDRYSGIGKQGPVLVQDRDYTLAYDNNEEVGNATVTITGAGNYTGSVEKTFKIIPYLTIYVQEGADGEEIAVASYNKAEFEALAEDDLVPVSGMFWQGGSGTWAGGWKVTTTNYYVVLSDLFQDLGIYWGEGASLSYGGDDDSGKSGQTYSYETIASQCLFFPNASGVYSNNPEINEPAPVVLSVTENSCTTGSGGDVEGTAADAQVYNIEHRNTSKEPRLLYGISEEGYLQGEMTSINRGLRYWDNCSYVTVVLPDSVTPFSDAVVTGIDASYTYTGSAIAPTPTVTLDGAVLASGTDYTVSYENNVNVGTATVVITPAGTWAGQDPIRVTFTIVAATPTTNVMTVYAGDNRYATADAIAAAVAEAGTYEGVIVCSAENGKYADALCASGLSGVLDYPIVLTNGSADTLDAATADAISALFGGGKGDVVVLGGTSTISTGIRNGLGAYDASGSATRIAGDDRYATAEEIYAWGTKHGSGWSTDYAVLAIGNNFPDALGAASFCTTFGAPMLLTNRDSSSLETYVQNATSGVGEVIIAGGTTSIPDQKISGITNTVRLAGDDRYQTNLMFASWELEHGMTLDSAGVATGTNFPDSLGSSYLLSLTGSVLLLSSPDDNTALYSMLSNNAENVHYVSIFGGVNSVSESVRASIEAAIGGTWEEKMQAG